MGLPKPAETRGRLNAMRLVLGIAALAMMVVATAATAEEGTAASDLQRPAIEQEAPAGTAAATAEHSEPAPVIPQYSGVSGDLSFDYQGGVGLLQSDSRGTPDVGFYINALSNRRTQPVLPERARLGDRGTPEKWDVGAIIGYQISDMNEPGAAAGVNLQMVTDLDDTGRGILFQPGFDYTMPFSDTLKLNARVFSTYVSDEGIHPGADTAARGNLGSHETEGGWRDVGLNLGLGYSMSTSWSIETQAGFTHSFGSAAKNSSQDDEAIVNDIFGGVFLNYRF